MKFRLTTSGYFYTDDQAAKLATLGFAFKELDPARDRSRDIDVAPTVEINTMKELLAFVRKWGRMITMTPLAEPGTWEYLK